MLDAAQKQRKMTEGMVAGVRKFEKAVQRGDITADTAVDEYGKIKWSAAAEALGP